MFMFRLVTSRRSCTSTFLRNSSLTKVIDDDHALVSYRPVGPFQMNQYLLTCKSTNEAAIIDSGENPGACFGAVISEGKYSINHLLQTHAHIDHVSGLKSTSLKYPNAAIYLHSAELPLYDTVEEQVKMFGLPCDLPLPPVTRFVSDGDVVAVGKLILNVLFVPGHSPGGCVYFCNSPKQPFAFVGDLIFRGSVGRTDLPLSNQRTMKDSIRKVVAALPSNTVLLPGHNDVTTMAEEIEHNPFIHQWVR